MNRLLIVSDSLTVNNGAHVATRAMIAALRERGVCVDLLLGSPADVEFCLRQNETPVSVFLLQEPRKGIRWFVQGVYRRLKIAPVPRWVLDPLGKMRRKMRGYDTILVIGENSQYRWLVAGVKGPRKVVFIHTDYVPWKTSCAWAIDDSRFDRLIYRGFDVIGVVGEANAARFREYYPEFAEKTRAFHNLFVDAASSPRQKVNDPVGNGHGEGAASTRIVTISRLELGPPKMMERLVRIAGELKRRGCRFDWKVYGKGQATDEARLKELTHEEEVDDMLHFVGFTRDVRGALAEADLHVLLSAYEGAPNVIIEAQLAGVPCISTDVGTAREMIPEGAGLILPQDEKMIVGGMANVLKKDVVIGKWKDWLAEYRYDNRHVMGEYEAILGLEYAR